MSELATPSPDRRRSQCQWGHQCCWL